MAMKSNQVTVKGISPLLMNKFPLDPPEALGKKPVAEQCEVVAYRTPTGQLAVPAENVQRGLIAAAAFSKGKGRASLQKIACASMFVSPAWLLLDRESFAIDSRPVVIPSTKGRVVRHRPRFDDWSIRFTVEWDDTLLTEAQVRRVVDDLGQRVGLLDFRPEKKGPFGRFIVTAWE